VTRFLGLASLNVKFLPNCANARRRMDAKMIIRAKQIAECRVQVKSERFILAGLGHRM